MKPEYKAVLLRYGEIGIKSKQTRRTMTRLLVKHIKTALHEKGIPYDKVIIEYGRIFIETSHANAVATAIARVFGIVSTSPVVVIDSNFEDILRVGFELAKSEFDPNKTFAVGARRLGTHDYTSQDVREKLGERIYEELGYSVNLSNPEQTIYVEVREDKAYIFTKTVKGVGGMPTGTQGKVVCTVSTGLDSPVAAYKVMKRGAVPILVYFDNAPYTGEGCTDLATRQARTLADYIYDYDVKLYVVPHGPDLEEAKCHAPERATCVMCKRNMYRLAREIAIREGADAITTGEIIGEQASQTTANLRAISSVVTDFPILRPNAGDDKTDIERLAAEIGTYDYAKEGLKCCTLAPKYPLLKADTASLDEIDREINFDIIKQEIDNAQVIILKHGKR